MGTNSIPYYSNHYITWCQTTKKNGKLCNNYKWFDKPGQKYICSSHKKMLAKEKVD